MKPDRPAVGEHASPRRVCVLVSILGVLLGISPAAHRERASGAAPPDRRPPQPNLAHDEAQALLAAYVPTRLLPPPTVRPCEREHTCWRQHVPLEARPARDDTASLPRPSSQTNRGGAHYRRGLAHWQLGRTAEAIDDLRAAEAWFHQHDPDYLPATTFLLERVLEVDPGRVLPAQARARLCDDWNTLKPGDSVTQVGWYRSWRD